MKKTKICLLLFTIGEKVIVNIIAHSMGGLVARRYIQSNNYRDDINQLVLLGTPNHGSSDVYTLWEGGVVPSNWKKLEQNEIGFILWFIKNVTAQTSDNYDTIHTYIPSIRELLPIYDFLEDSEGNLKSHNSLIEARNPFLTNLNDDGDMRDLPDKINGITVIAGSGESTVSNIPTIERDATEIKLWKDGLPNPMPPTRDNTEGDNRVLLSSARIDPWSIFPPVLTQSSWQKLFGQVFRIAHAQFEGEPGEFLKQKEVNSKHGALPTVAINDVFETLELPAPTIAYTPPAEPENITSFWFASPVQVKITDPQGRTITKDVNNIPGAVYSGESDLNGVKMVIIPNSSPGQYKIELIGTGDGQYHMAVANFNDSQDTIVTVEKNVMQGEKVEYQTEISPDSSFITISKPVITPPAEESAVGLLKNLIEDLGKYYGEKKISNKGMYQSLLADLKLALVSVEEMERTRPAGEKYPKLHDLKVTIAQKLAVNKLNSFISKVEKQSGKKIEPDTASLLIATAQEIVEKI